jgi:hypothetical protein
MALATKNGSLLIKSGAIPTNCGCCSKPCAELFSATGLTAVVQAYDWTHYKKVSYNGSYLTRSDFFPGSQYAGNFSLSLTSETSDTRVWTYTYPTSSQICGGFLRLEIVSLFSGNCRITMRSQMISLTTCYVSGETEVPASGFSCSTASNTVISEFYNRVTVPSGSTFSSPGTAILPDCTALTVWTVVGEHENGSSAVSINFTFQ